MVCFNNNLAFPRRYSTGRQWEGLTGHLFRRMICAGQLEYGGCGPVTSDWVLYFSWSKNALVWSHTH